MDEAAKRGLRQVCRRSHQFKIDDVERYSNSVTYRVNGLVSALSWCVSYTDSRRQVHAEFERRRNSRQRADSYTLCHYKETVAQLR